MTYMTYVRTDSRGPSILEIQPVKGTIRVPKDVIDLNILQLHPLCLYIGEFVGVPLTKVYFEDEDLVIVLDLNMFSGTFSSLAEIDLLWKMIDDATKSAFEVPCRNLAEIKITLRGVSADDEYISDQSHFDESDHLPVTCCECDRSGKLY